MKLRHLVCSTLRSILLVLIIAAVASLTAQAQPANLVVSYQYQDGALVTGFIHEFGPTGIDLGALVSNVGATGLVFDSSGNLFASLQNDSVRVYDPVGTDLGAFTTSPGNTVLTPEGLAFDNNGNLYVANYGGASIGKFPPTGGIGIKFTQTGLNGVAGLAFDKTGNLYASNYLGGTIRKFGPTGTDLGVFATLSGGLDGLAFDKSGDLYAVRNLFNTIEKFGPTGTDLGVFASTGLNNPVGIAFDGSGDLYAANAGDGTIHEFGPTGADLGTFATTPGMNYHALWLAFAPVPEPSSGLLLLMGGFMGWLMLLRSARWMRF